MSVNSQGQIRIVHHNYLASTIVNLNTKDIQSNVSPKKLNSNGVSWEQNSY